MFDLSRYAKQEQIEKVTGKEILVQEHTPALTSEEQYRTENAIRQLLHNAFKKEDEL